MKGTKTLIRTWSAFALLLGPAAAGGYDSDCNPSTACGVLGTMLGRKGLDPKFYRALDEVKGKRGFLHD